MMNVNVPYTSIIAKSTKKISKREDHVELYIYTKNYEGERGKEGGGGGREEREGGTGWAGVVQLRARFRKFFSFWHAMLRQ